MDLSYLPKNTTRLTFLSLSWNNYFTPALILHEPKKRTVPILIAQLRSLDWSSLPKPYPGIDIILIIAGILFHLPRRNLPAQRYFQPFFIKLFRDWLH